MRRARVPQGVLVSPARGQATRTRSRTVPLSDRAVDVLGELGAARGMNEHNDGWCRSMDINATWYPSTLRTLVRRGFVATKQRGSLRFPQGRTGRLAWETTQAVPRGSRLYRITDDGAKWLAQQRERT